MHFKVDDVRIREIKELAPPSQLLREFPCSEKTEESGFVTNIELIHDWLLFRGREPKSAANGREPTLSRRSPFEGNALLNLRICCNGELASFDGGRRDV